MRRRSTYNSVMALSCLTIGFVLGGLTFAERMVTHNAGAAAIAANPAAASPQSYLPIVRAAQQPELVATIEALIAQQAEQATAIVNWSDAVSYLATQVPAQQAEQATAIAGWIGNWSYLATQVPAQNRVATVDVLVYQRAELATQVAELYTALGSPVPTEVPSPTRGPSPTPTRTPWATQTGQ
jgi:hypothetical protein